MHCHVLLVWYDGNSDEPNCFVHLFLAPRQYEIAYSMVINIKIVRGFIGLGIGWCYYNSLWLSYWETFNRSVSLLSFQFNYPRECFIYEWMWHQRIRVRTRWGSIYCDMGYKRMMWFGNQCDQKCSYFTLKILKLYCFESFGFLSITSIAHYLVI